MQEQTVSFPFCLWCCIVLTVQIRKDLVQFSVDDLKLVSPSGKQYFSLSNLKIPGLKNLKNLHADVVETRQV